MNRKECELRRIVRVVADCCSIRQEDGSDSITIEDVLGRARTENVVMTRCILVAELVRHGYSITTAAHLLGRTVQGIRRMLRNDDMYVRTSRAYRIAKGEVAELCRQSSTGSEETISSGVSVMSGCTGRAAFSQGVISSI